MLLKLLRNGLGNIIIFIDWLTRPAKMVRTPEQQTLVENKLKEMRLYQLYACPFCIKTRRALRRLNLPLEIQSVSSGSPYREELELGGGRIQVPCLRINKDSEIIWMYESSDIVNYLDSQFGQAPVASSKVAS